MILAGLWSSDVHPSMQLYMQPVITMLKALESEGITTLHACMTINVSCQ